MNFFDRLRNGWRLGMTSIKIIRENKSLLLFPVLSSAALITVVLTFVGGTYAVFGTDFERMIDEFLGTNEILAYTALFVFYLISYFIIVFFNVALVHCARMIFDGQTPSIKDGLAFSGSRVGTILSWAFLSATVGVILQAIEERLGWIGQIVVGLIGAVWSIATFFVVPILAYEEVGPLEALKRSGKLMREKWGEAIGANFSFGVFFLLGYLIIIVGTVALFAIHPILGIVSGVLSALLLHTVVSAAKMVFIAATYNHMMDRPAGRFDDAAILDGVFIQK